MICLPAFVYLVLCIIQIVLDFYNGLYNTAFIKIIVTIIITFILNLLCYMDLGFISWIIVLVPFLFMSLIVTIILYGLGYDAATGTSIQPIQQKQQEQYYLQTEYTSPPIPPKFLPEVITSPPNNNSPIEEKNIYLISYVPNQQQLPIPFPNTQVYPPTTYPPTTYPPTTYPPPPPSTTTPPPTTTTPPPTTPPPTTPPNTTF
jgi:hypothetical protein